MDKNMVVFVTWERLQKLEAITENTLKKLGYVPDSLAQELASAQVAYAVAKDDLHDPYLKQ